jgi:hypothetical protein
MPDGEQGIAIVGVGTHDDQRDRSASRATSKQKDLRRSSKEQDVDLVAVNEASSRTPTWGSEKHILLTSKRMSSGIPMGNSPASRSSP